jgi:hypothetical protein
MLPPLVRLALMPPPLVEPPEFYARQGELGLIIWSLVDQDDARFETRCWRWHGKLNMKGRPRFYGTVEGMAYDFTVYKRAYEWFNDLLMITDPNLTVDHVCGDKVCMNHRHWQLMSRGENSERMHQSRRERTGQ